MSGATSLGLLAIDVGTSRVKLGWFPNVVACSSPSPSSDYLGGELPGLPIAAPRLPEPTETFDCSHRDQTKFEFAEELTAWLGQFIDSKPQVVIASVNPPVTTVVVDALKACGFAAPRILQTSELPIRLAVDEPAKLGIDRALAAVAVNRIRLANTPAIVVSLGTACTVNLISADGVFQGGAILPGFNMAANALHAGTASLPLISSEGMSSSEHAVGKNTAEAIAAGLYWGILGAIEKLIAEQSGVYDTRPQLFLTGGDAAIVIEALETSGHRVRLLPHLVLSGIAIACEAES
jgi:type III pantothenate kinase